MGKVQTEKINRQILTAQGKGRIRALNRHGTIHPIQHLCAAVNSKSRALRALSLDAEIGRECTAEIRRERQLCVRPQAVKGQSRDLQMCRIGEICWRKSALTRDIPAERLRRKILEREHSVHVRDIGVGAGDANIADRPALCRHVSVGRRSIHRPRHADIGRDSSRIGALRIDRRGGKVLRAYAEIEIGRIRIEAHRAIDTRRLLRRRRRCRHEESALIKAQSRTRQRRLRAVEIGIRPKALDPPLHRARPVHETQPRAHAVGVQRTDLHALGQRPLGQEGKERRQICIICRELHILHIARFLPAYAQRNAHELCRSIVGECTAVDVHRAAQIGQFIAAPRHNGIRRTVYDADAPDKGARLRIVRDEIGIVPRAVLPLHEMRMHARQQDLIHRGRRG